MKRKLVSLSLIVLLLMGAKCDDTKAVAQFTASTNRIARYTEDFIRIVDEAKNQKLLTAQQAAALVTVARQENTVNSDLVNEAAKYVETKPDGSKELHFTEEGKANVVKLGSSVRDLANNLVNDPVLNSLPPDVRARINIVSSGLTAAALSAYTFATKIKPEKK